MKNSLLALILSFIVCILSILYCTVETTKTNAIVSTDLPVIILDAGHGGEDGGAVAFDGTQEKNLNLEITLKVNDILSVFGFKTHLIRTDDNSIHSNGDSIRERKISDIRNRADTMNLYDDCIYLSIHQNKYSDNQVWGTQTFYSDCLDESEEIARFIQMAVVNHLQQNNKREIKKSGTDIYVLYNATKPAVMVECGFISNKGELEKLKDFNYQCLMAMSISIGVINYNISEENYGSEI